MTALARRAARAERIRAECLAVEDPCWATKAGAWRVATEILLGVPMTAERAAWWEGIAARYVGPGKPICEVVASCILETLADEQVVRRVTPC